MPAHGKVKGEGAEIMEEAMALSAAGTATWRLLCLPACPFKNQAPSFQSCHREGLCTTILEGISLSQKERTSFVPNGNEFSAQTILS